ncbi:F510_1955 family glycosylhydrolase [Bacillaceae bacterium CLA-AA-H227]|uniref:Sortilin N-terminal domain-containing protein n=2 Tax=Robertmurraya TaxID=2837507 RepID=A0A4U1D1V3_9BACI|nr:hypothetical protein [Robertmurraya kyonggiensis]TKC15026.1 hypothetical protein FA727_19200 [Robertmurraya kyonggiensis]
MKKIKILTGILVAGLSLSACSSDDDSAENKKVDSDYKVEHVHGLAYTKDNAIYLASHEGLIQTKDNGENWSFTGDVDFDFMGFHVQSDGTMLTSGHPGPESDLPDPLGLMESNDNGQNWESKSLLGEVDFHVLTSNHSNPNLLFGVIQMESDKYEAGIYKSIDKGSSWEKIKATGLPKDLHGIYTLVSLPSDENVLLAGTNEGVLRSENGGQNWENVDNSRLITSISTIPGTNDLISYSILENEAGVMISKDYGASWKNIGLYLEEDAVAYFAINPEDTEKIAVVTFENSLLISEDGGQNWETLMDKGTLKN